MEDRAVLVSACRTPIGTMGGSLSSISAEQLGSIVIKEALLRAGVQAEQVDMVYMGCVLQAGQGQNVARQAAIHAGLPIETPAVTVNVVCGSGLESVNMAARLILLGEADVVVAGGMENMSKAPYLMPNARFGYRMNNGALVDSMVNDALWDAFNQYHMGITAENICDQWSISREELDNFAVNSQQKCAEAMSTDRFNDEIVPVYVPNKKGGVTVSKDENPRPTTTLESVGKLRPAFRSDGRVTAANSSGINDGAAAVVLMSEKKAKELHITPMAYWVGGALCGVDPAVMGIGPVASTKKLLDRLSLTIDDIDLIEANEAFAAQSLAVARDLHIDTEKLNVNGGAIALGHPVGASGCRILVTLLHEMRRRGSHLGLATLCVGGGMGCSTVVECMD